MKNFFMLVCMGLFASYYTDAQSFTSAHDTINFTYSGAAMTVNNHISVPASGPNVVLKWNVESTSFDAALIGILGICDNNTCYPGTVATGSLPTQTTMPYIAGSTGDFHLQLADGAASGSRFMRIRFINPSVPDTSYQTYNVVSTLSTDDILSVVQQFAVFPNPAAHQAQITFCLASESQVLISLVDPMGKVVSTIENEKMKEGYHKLNVQTGEFPTGIYSLLLRTEKGTFTQMLTVVR